MTKRTHTLVRMVAAFVIFCGIYLVTCAALVLLGVA